MKLENRLPAEGINASHEHPLKEFAWLVLGVVGALALLAVAVSHGAQWLAPRIPFEYETRLVGDRLAAQPRSERGRAVQAELQALADRLAARMALPRGMKVRVGYHEGGMVNAVATLGGQTMFFRGLLAKLESEDALAMVMAHEIAHLKYRHPAAALGRGVALGVVLSLLSADLGRSAAGGALGQAGAITLLSFNRDQERQADEEALRVLAAEYGHVGGALDLFAVFMRAQGGHAGGAMAGAEFLGTHPLTANRVAAVRRWALAHGKPSDGPHRPLSPILAAVRAQTSAAGERGAADGTKD
jgi:predicted Zn-dependent protease